MEKKIVTLAELKGEEVRLRNELEQDNYGLEALTKYLKVSRKVKELEEFLLWTILSLILMFSGCAKVMQGTGLIFEGVGDGVVAGGQHLQESASK